MTKEYEIYKEVAKKLGIPVSDVELAARHQYKFLRLVIEEGELETVKLPSFGKFYVNHIRRDALRGKTQKPGTENQRRKRKLQNSNQSESLQGSSDSRNSEDEPSV